MLKLRGDGARPPHVVIVGAGFGGLAAARRLAAAPVDVTLIDRRNHHLFQPLLYQVATAALSPADIAAPIRAVLRDAPHITVLLDEVVGVDVERRCVLTRDDASARFDYLILAAGSGYSYFGHEEEWAPLAPGVKTVEDAVDIRRRLLLAFERAESTRDQGLRRRLTTFVLVGAGPTGVEMAGAMAELARATLARDFRRIDPRDARILLVEAGSRVLPALESRVSDYALRTLSRMGVEVRLNCPIEQIDSEGVIACGERIEAGTVLWCAGVKAAPVAGWLNADAARNGGVKVAPDLSVPALPEVFVVGDAAWVTDEDGRPLPGLAPVAKQQGDYVADLIRRRVEGKPPPAPFRYRDRGMLATIGRSAAVAEIGGVRLTGLVGWVVWGVAHIYFLIGFRNRLAVFVSWMWSWITYGRGARLITGSEAVRLDAGSPAAATPPGGAPAPAEPDRPAKQAATPPRG